MSIYEQFLLWLVAWREARGESATAQLGVMWSVRNRAAKPSWWGNSIVSVILKPFQYSSFNANDPNATKLPAEKDAAWLQIQKLDGPDPTQGATHYYSTDIPEPEWAAQMTCTASIGSLKFYR